MLGSDNAGTIVLAKDNKYHACTNHIAIKYHFIWELTETGDIALEYVMSEGNIEDIMMKALGQVKHEPSIEQLGLAVT